MSSTYSPAPGAATFSRMVLAQAAMEARLMMRNGEQLLLAIVIPVILLVGAVQGADRLGLDLSRPAVDVFTPGVLALAVMSTAFTSLAIATGFERRYGVLKRLGASPLPRSGMLLGKVLALFLVEVAQVVVIGAIAGTLGWSPDPNVAATVATMLVGTAAFASLGLFVAGVMRAEATLAAANLIYLLLMVGGGVVVPSSAYGDFETVARHLPSGALGDAMRSALIHGSLDVGALSLLAAWAAIGTLLTARTFSWE